MTSKKVTMDDAALRKREETLQHFTREITTMSEAHFGRQKSRIRSGEKDKDVKQKKVEFEDAFNSDTDSDDSEKQRKKEQDEKERQEAELDAEYDTDCENEERPATAIDHDLAVYRKTCRKLGIVPNSRMEKLLTDEIFILRHRGVKPAEILAISNALVHNMKVQELQLSGNRVGAQGVRYISWMLQANSDIHSLDLSENIIDTGLGARLLGESLASNRHITYLNLSDNGFQDEDCEYFGRMLEENKSIETLNLSKNDIGDVGVEHIFTSLNAGRNEYLKNLNLGWNKIRSKGGKIISTTCLIPDNIGLQSLDLSMNGLGNDGATYLSKGLQKNTTLVHLNLSENRINDLGALEMIKSLKQNESLKTLSFNRNPLTPMVFIGIFEYLKKLNKVSLSILDISSHHLPKDVLQLYADVIRIHPDLDVIYAGVHGTKTYIGINRGSTYTIAI